MSDTSSRRALLVGAPTGGLRGVERDLDRMGELLTAWRYECQTCVGPAATRDGILSAIQSLGTAASGPTVLYFSGHGGQYVVTGANLPPLPLYYLMPVREHGSGASHGVLHHEVFALLERLYLNVTVIFDCGYTVTKSRTSGERVRALPTREVTWQEVARRHFLDTEIHERGFKQTNSCDVTVFATQLGAAAFEAEIDGHIAGHFTAALCASLMATRQSPQPWKKIIGEVRSRIVANRFSQTQEPQVFGDADRLPFIAGHLLAQSESYDPIPFSEGRFNSTTGSVPEADEFVAGASQAIKSAIKVSREQGVPTTHMIDGKLVRIHPDGTQQPL